MSEGQVYIHSIGECRRIFAVLIRRLTFKYAQCHPGSCLSQVFNYTPNVSEVKRILIKLCGTERPEIDLIWWGKVNTKSERRAFAIITHSLAGKLFRFSYLEEETVNFTMMYCLYFLKQGRQCTYNVH